MAHGDRIPDQDYVYRPVHRTWLRDDGTPKAGGFKFYKNDNGFCSVDWTKLCSAEESRGHRPVPSDNAVFQINAGAARRDSTIRDVIHLDDADWPPHSGIYPEDDELSVQRALQDLAEPVLGLEDTT